MNPINKQENVKKIELFGILICLLYEGGVFIYERNEFYERRISGY